MPARGDADEHALILRPTLGRYPILRGHVQSGRVHRTGEKDLSAGEPELPPVYVERSAARHRLDPSEELHRLAGLLPQPDPPTQLDLRVGTGLPTKPDSAGQPEVKIEAESVDQAGAVIHVFQRGRSEAPRHVPQVLR